MQIEFMAKSYGALAVVDVTLLASTLAARRRREIGLTKLNADAEGEKERRPDRWLRYEHALK